MADTKKNKAQLKEVDESVIILDKEQEITIYGKSYKMRRLSTRDVFTFSKLISKALRQVGHVDVQSQEAFALVLMSGLAENNEEICEFYGSLVDMSAEDFMNQPPEFLGEFLDILPEQYDLQAFFATVLKAIKSLGSLWQN